MWAKPDGARRIVGVDRPAIRAKPDGARRIVRVDQAARCRVTGIRQQIVLPREIAKTIDSP